MRSLGCLMEPAMPLFCLRAQRQEAFGCATNAYVREHLPRLLPGWQASAAWAVVLLQQASVSLADPTPTVTAEKQRLRTEFIVFGFALAFALQSRGFAAEVFDPRSAYPLLSPPGDLRHNDVRAASQLPAMKIVPGICPMLQHPVWGTAVYPATILVSAPPVAIAPLLAATARARGWENLELDAPDAIAAPPQSP